MTYNHVLYGNHTVSDWEDHEEYDDRQDRHTRRQQDRQANRKAKRTRAQRSPRSERDQAFKCGHCKQFIGAPISGGRHRNHCPNCLHSKHVDEKMPGDRRSECGSLMAPVGVLNRRNGEQLILHRCLGCGKESPNRIAADDNPIALLRIPPAPPAPGVDRAIPSSPGVFEAVEPDVAFDGSDDVQSA